MIEVGRAGVSIRASESDRTRLRAEFLDRGAIRFPGFLAPELVARVLDDLDRVSFSAFERDFDIISRPLDPRLCDALSFLMNDPSLFELIRFVSGAAAIRSFMGGVIRQVPGEGHRIDWHDDVRDARAAALTIDLSRKPFRGGLLQLRLRGERILFEIANVAAGDAVLFRIGPGLEHRNTPVLGESPKTAFAGWFRTEPVPPGDPWHAAAVREAVR